MSHNIEYVSYPQNCDRKKVQTDCNNVAIHADWQEGCSGVNPIRWLDNVGVCENYDSARDYIDKVDNGWYDCLAVQYKSPKANTFDDKTLDSLKKRKDEAYRKYYELSNNPHFANVKSSTIGCKHCNSKIATAYMNKRNTCPVCNAEMRPQTILNKINTLLKAYREIEDKVTARRNELTAKNYEIKWLVKYEYHT